MILIRSRVIEEAELGLRFNIIGKRIFIISIQCDEGLRQKKCYITDKSIF